MPPVSNETLLRYCTTIYDILAKDTKRKKINGKMVHLWEGKIVETFAGSGVSNAFYGKVLNTLYEIGCLYMLRRGARGSLTQIIVLRRPEGADLERVHGLTSHLTSPSEYDTLSQRVQGLERRFDGIDVAKMFQLLENRLRVLEAKLAGE
jgi:hypothetical protein